MRLLDKTRKRSPLLILGAALTGFVLLVGTRYKEAYAERRALQVAQAQAASESSEGNTPQGSASALVSGTRTRWRPRISLTGTVLPIRDTALSFKAMGRLTSVRVKVGDRVKAGQLLAELDGSEARAQLAVAQAQVHTAEAQYEFAKENEQRTHNLYEHRAISETLWVADYQRSELARVQLEAARAQVELARTGLTATQLYAPFAGSVIDAPSGAGAIVTPGVVLFRIQDASSLKLSATISPEEALFAKVGARVEIVRDSPRADMHVGHVTAVLPSVDSKTRRLPIIAEVPNQGPARLLANMFVRAILVPEAPIDVLKLPATAIRAGSQDEVAVIDNGSVRIVHVAYARADDGSILVRSGLSAHDRVLAAPNARAKPGDAWPEVAP